MLKKQSKDIKPFVKYIKMRRRKAFLELNHVGWFIVCSIIALILIIASYLIKGCSSWFSSLFQSVSAGIITGLVLYVLNNIRSNQANKLDDEINKFRELNILINDIYQNCPSPLMKSLSRSGDVEFEHKLMIAIECAKLVSKKLSKMGYDFAEEFEDNTNISIVDFEKIIDSFYESIPEQYTEKLIFEYTDDFKQAISKPFIFISARYQLLEIKKQEMDRKPI